MRKLIVAALLVAFALASQARAEEAAKKTADIPQRSVFFDVKHPKKIEPDKKNLAKHKAVVKCFTEYWGAIKKGDLKKAYALEDSEYQKKVGYDLYVDRMKGKIKIMVVEPLEVKKRNQKEVMVRGIMRYRAGMIDTARMFDDEWIKEGDTYRHVSHIEKEEVKKKDSAGKK